MATTSTLPRKRLPYVWDYDIDEAMFDAMLAGELTWGRLDRDWAAVRLLEYAPYPEIVQQAGLRSAGGGVAEMAGTGEIELGQAWAGFFDGLAAAASS